jgi:drug/metabolite transporter (DMT)-like permease
MNAMILALAATIFFGLSSVMEQRSTKQVPERGALSPRLLADLAGKPLWLAAIAVNIAGSVLQVLALHFGPLALVQPIIVCNLPFAVLKAALARHREPDWTMLAGVICCAAGIAGFLAAAHSSGGHKTVSCAAALPLAGALAVAAW